MRLARRQHDRLSSDTQIGDAERFAHFPEAIAAIVRVPEPELAEHVVAPAFDGPVVEHRARPYASRSDRDRGPSKAEHRAGKRIAHLARLVAAVLRVAEP